MQIAWLVLTNICKMYWSIQPLLMHPSPPATDWASLSHYKLCEMTCWSLLGVCYCSDAHKTTTVGPDAVSGCFSGKINNLQPAFPAWGCSFLCQLQGFEAWAMLQLSFQTENFIVPCHIKMMPPIIFQFDFCFLQFLKKKQHKHYNYLSAIERLNTFYLNNWIKISSWQTLFRSLIKGLTDT